MADLTTASADTMLTAAPCVPTTVYYLSLHTATPGTTGASEVTGGSYVRQAITFGTPSAGAQVSAGTDAAQSFTGMPVEAGGTPYFGIWTASTSGTYLGGGTMSGLSGAISAGSTITVASGGISLSVA